MAVVCLSLGVPYQSSLSAQPQEPWRDAPFSGMASRLAVVLYPFCLLPLRLPLFCLGWRRSFSDQFLICEPLPDDTISDTLKPVGIVSLSVIVPITLFIKIPEEMEWFNTDISAFDGSLYQAPEVLNTVGVNLAPDILFGVVNHFMDKLILQVGIGAKCIGVDAGTRIHILSDFWGKSLTAGVGNHFGSDSTVTIWAMSFQESQHGGFAYATTSLYLSLTLVLVHEESLTAHESFINFYLTRHFVERFRLHRQADTVKHEPSGFLSDANHPVDFIGTDSVLGVGNHPDGSKPLIERNWAIFKDGAHLDGELPLFVLALALPDTASRNETDIYTATSRASYAIRPTEFDHEVKADIRVREVFDSFDKCCWLAHVSTS